MFNRNASKNEKQVFKFDINLNILKNYEEMNVCIKHAKISSHSVLINDLYAQLRIPYLVVKNKSPRILLWLPPNLL